MVALFGCVWAVVTTAACVLAVASRRSVMAWMKARRWRKSGDDTVEIVRPGLRKAAVYAALVVLALPAGVMAGGTALPGPSGGGGGLPTTGGTMTGQVVSSGVACENSTATNEDWTFCPAGTGRVVTQSPFLAYTANGVEMTICDTSTAGYANLRVLDSNCSTQMGLFGLGNSGSISPWNGRLYMTADSTSLILISTQANVAAGTDAILFRDNSSGTTIGAIDGNGAYRYPVLSAAHGATCNSGAEGLTYYRVIDASNKSGMCTCARTSSGVYGWKAGVSFGSSALADGDC